MENKLRVCACIGPMYGEPYCLQAEREEDAERQHAVEMGKAMQRIAVAAGIELAQPGEIADIVCVRLIAPPNG